MPVAVVVDVVLTPMFFWGGGRGRSQRFFMEQARLHGKALQVFGGSTLLYLKRWMVYSGATSSHACLGTKQCATERPGHDNGGPSPDVLSILAKETNDPLVLC